MKHTGRCLTSLVGAAALVLAGCAGGTPTPVQSGSPGIRTIGIARVAAPKLTVAVGSEGRYAMSEVRKSGLPAEQGPTGTPAVDAMGGIAQVGSSSNMPDVVLAPVVLIMAPMMFIEILGGLSGGGDAGPTPGEEMPSDMLGYYKAQLGGAASDIQLRETLRDSVFNEISGKTGFGVRRLGEATSKPAGPVEASEPIDTILEIDDTQVALVPKGRESIPRLMLYAKFHLSRADTGARLYTTEVATTSDSRPFRDWIVNDAALFRRALEDLIEPLARQAVSNALLDLPNPKAAHYPLSGMAFYPIQPEYPAPVISSKPSKFPHLDSLQPTLRWRAFPSREDIASDFTGQLKRATNVTYDLKIPNPVHSGDFLHIPRGRYGRGSGSSPVLAGDFLHIDGLTQPSFTLTEPLRPGMRYSWTVRARFEIDGFPRSTGWMVVKDYDRFWVGDCGDPYESNPGKGDYTPKRECLAGLQTRRDPWQQTSLIRPIGPRGAALWQDPESAGKGTTNSLRPTLRWRAFPDSDIPADDPYARLGRVTNVTYDLRLWKQLPFFNRRRQFDLTLENINGLNKTSYELPFSLEPDTLYFWTVRAVFEVDGVSENGGWTPNQSCADKSWQDLPDANCLVRFRTLVEQAPDS